jgi:hypothetical protein
MFTSVMPGLHRLLRMLVDSAALLVPVLNLSVTSGT